MDNLPYKPSLPPGNNHQFIFQVISLEVRSNLDEGYGVIQKKELSTVDNAMNQNQLNEEINYVYVLNKILPDEIRVLAWTGVAPDFKAR
jgi:tRNA pseudouridine38/39 synthase